MARRRAPARQSPPASSMTTQVEGRVSVCPANIAAVPPTRKCVATGQRGDSTGMVRFVVSPDGEVVPDLAGRLPGRGFWVRPGRDMIRPDALAREVSKTMGMKVTVPDDLADRLERMLADRCLQVIGLARRAGEVTAGFEKVAEALRNGELGVLIEGSDGSQDGRRKLRALAPDAPVIDLFTSAELGGALGRESATHVLIRIGGLAARLRTEVVKLEGLRDASVGARPNMTTLDFEPHLEA